MTSLISPRNVTGYWKPGQQWGHSVALAPFFAVHAAYQQRTGTDKGWVWNERAARECVGAAWNMTGEWQARRVATCSPKRFENAVIEWVPWLSARLNRFGVLSLKDLGGLEDRQYQRVVNAIHDAVTAVSSLRKTKEVEPVLGSKVLHHFFPSVVPVFDRQYIRFGAMKLAEYRDFVAADQDDWIVLRTAREAGGSRLLDYHRYLAFCAAQIDATPRKTLKRVRQSFARGFSDLAPAALAASKSLLWKLDAKLAEYCLVNKAHRGGLIKDK